MIARRIIYRMTERTLAAEKNGWEKNDRRMIKRKMMDRRTIEQGMIDGRSIQLKKNELMKNVEIRIFLKSSCVIFDN